jgi:hypothetical protein
MLSVTLTTPIMKTLLIYHYFLTSFKQMLTLLSTLKARQLKLGMPSLLQGLLVMMRGLLVMMRGLLVMMRGLLVMMKVRRLEYIFSAIEVANRRLDRRVHS